MKRKMGLFVVMLFSIATISYAVEDQASPAGPQAVASQSLGAQAGEAARELKGTAGETLSTGTMKVAESSKKVQSEARETLNTLQEQWDVLAKQLQEKTKQVQKQLELQWRDFNKSFNKPQP